MLAAIPAFADYSTHEDAPAFIERMTQHGFEPEQTRAALVRARSNADVLRLIARPAERTLSWDEYRGIFLTDETIRRGGEFARKHRKALKRAEERYGVPRLVILGILGVETRYGKILGRYPVLDALATLGFDYPRRAKFFRGELEAFLIMAREENIDVRSLKGSYAGAFGLGQFIPSSFRSYAVDFDGDGDRDLVRSPTDAIGSIANYLSENGWKRGGVIVVRAEPERPGEVIEILEGRGLGRQGLKPVEALEDEQGARALSLNEAPPGEYWIGLHNFWVITRYNRSQMYALAVYQLGRAVMER